MGLEKCCFFEIGITGRGSISWQFNANNKAGVTELCSRPFCIFSNMCAGHKHNMQLNICVVVAGGTKK